MGKEEEQGIGKVGKEERNREKGRADLRVDKRKEGNLEEGEQRRCGR